MNVKVHESFYSKEVEEKLNELFRKDPIFYTSDNGAIESMMFGNSTYDFEIAKFLKDKTPEEIEKLKTLAKIDKLERELIVLKASI